MPASPPPPPRVHLPGLDAVRVVALGLVTAHHALTLTGRSGLTVVAGLSVGQVGVALFLAVSGLLAAQSRRPPATWLLQRLRKLFPAYWIVVGGSLLLAGLLAHKSFDAYQVVAQLCGLGMFTDRENLVNTPTWFVSLILLCYLGTFAARLARVPLASGVGVSLVLGVLVAVGQNPWLEARLLTYSLAFTIASAPRGWAARLVLPAGVGLLALAVAWQPTFGYTAVALVGVEAARRLPRSPGFVRAVAHYSYEYYLVHGVALFGMVWLLPAAPLAAVGLGVGLAALAAVGLQRLVAWLDPVGRGETAPRDSWPARHSAGLAGSSWKR